MSGCPTGGSHNARVILGTMVSGRSRDFCVSELWLFPSVNVPLCLSFSHKVSLLTGSDYMGVLGVGSIPAVIHNVLPPNKSAF